MPRRQPTGELLSRGLRLAIVEILSSRYVADEIDRLFESEGWSLDDLNHLYRESPRERAQSYDREVDFADPGDAAAYLIVVGHVIARLEQDEAEESWPEKQRPPRLARERIERELRRAGSEQDDDGAYRLPERVAVSETVLDAAEGTGLARTVASLRRADASVEEKIGLSKELVESVIKIGLERLGETYDAKDDVPALSKRLHRALSLDARAIQVGDEKARVALRRLLSNATELPHNLATLRNGIGAGHGRAEAIAASSTTSDFAARLADAYAVFILTELDDID